MLRTEKAIEIDAPVERVFDLFSDFENFPQWMHNIKDVHHTGRRFSRWTARAPLGTSVEWEAETIVFEPDHRIVWRTVRGDVNTSGEVIFETTRRGTTLLRVSMGYDPPAGRLGALVASLFHRNPEQQLDEDLRRFAEIAEGRTPPRAPVQRDAREAGVDRHESFRRDERSAPRRDDARFDEALRNARRSQREDGRRYQQERERDAVRRRRGEGDEPHEPSRRHRGFEERAEWLHSDEGIRRGQPPPSRREPQTGRFALTPRERARELETERERRIENAPEEVRKVLRRGVDRLIEDAPGRPRRR
ncbi:MAG: SRPBCC family protein [Pyrinomonadaceae bacterium]